MKMSKEQQFDFYWKEIFDGLAYNPIEFNVYRFDQSMSLPSKFNKLYEMFKQLAMNNQEVLDYLKEFMETFDFKLETTIKDVLVVWLNEGLLADVVREAINDEVTEARTDYLDHEYLTLKERLDIERKEVIEARGGERTLDERLKKTIKVGTEKFFTPEMQGSFFWIGAQPHQRGREQVDKYKAMGFDGGVITLHIDGDANCDIRESMSAVYETLDYAKEKGLKTNVCKFHAVASRVDLTNPSVQQAYVSQVLRSLTELEPYGIDTVYLFNEFGVLFRTQTGFCIDTINLIKGLGYRVGVTFQYNDNRNSTQTNLDGLMVDIPQLFSAVDIIGLNVYPRINYDWRNATRNDSVKAWSEIYPIMEQMKETFKKPIIFTEAGCLYYYQCLANPEIWDPSILESQLQDEEATRIFWYGLLNDHRLKSLVDGVYTWFLEKMKDPKTIGFFKHYNERV